MTRRVVVTGMGIISSIGNNIPEVLQSLKEGKSGIIFEPTYQEHGMRSCIHGAININPMDHIDRRILRFMGNSAAYNYLAMQEAIQDSGLEKKDISHERTGLITGSGGPSTVNLLEAWDIARKKTIKAMGPYKVPQCMASTNSANLATAFKIKGASYSITSACATSAHCIGNAAQLIQSNIQDVVFAGGAEELDWTLSCLFDAMGALSSKYNHKPTIASRPFDSNRDGFVISGGGGTLVLEEYEHAKARGAKIYAELAGYGLSSDGYDMVSPSGEGAIRCLRQATKNIKQIDYINAHATSTLVGDIMEAQAIKEYFQKSTTTTYPMITSTKSMTGHSLGAAGVHEAIYTLLMIKYSFVAPSINIDNIDDACADLPIITHYKNNVNITTALSNSFGFGGTNCSLVFRKIND